MEYLQTQKAERERILSELKNIIKQIYHEAVNQELRQENVDYITYTLVKRLDESLLYGAKNLQYGYWKVVQKILHPDSLTQILKLPGVSQSALSKGRAWVLTCLLDDAFGSYMNCFVREKCLDKYFEEWSILRNSDSCNCFLSLLSGIENVSFLFEVVDANKPLQNCTLSPRVISPAPFWSPPSSLTDSGVQLDKSEDYLNGNIPTPVVLRRKTKHGDRHVSFHEDSYSKSPSQRKLKWDVESSRFSWAGEDLDILNLTDLKLIRPAMEERGTPEGQEAPRDFRSSDSKLSCSLPKFPVARSLVPTKNNKRLSCRKTRIDWDSLAAFTHELDFEIRSFRRGRSIHEVDLPGKLLDMVGVTKTCKKWSFKPWGKMLIVTEDRIVILHKDLCTTILTLAQLEQIVVYPHKHSFHLLTRKQTYVLTSGDESLSDEILSRLAFNMHRAGLPDIDFRILHPEDILNVKKELVNRRILTKAGSVLHLGMVRLQQSDSPSPVAEEIEKRGFVMYQIGNNQTWLPGELLLRGGILYLYSEGKNPLFAINLVTSCETCERTAIPDRPHTFQLTLKHPASFDGVQNCFYEDLAVKTELTPHRNSLLDRWTKGRLSGDSISQFVERMGGILKSDTANLGSCLHIAAADEYEMSDWLQAILQVFCQTNDKSWETEACEASLLITEETVVLFVQPAPPQCGFKVLASALIAEISSFSVGAHPMDSYCIIELECMEVGVNTSDWVLHFGSRRELERVKNQLEKQWRHQDTFPVRIVNDSRCERTQACLTREWFA